MDYFITAKEEVLREKAASIIAKTTRFMIDNNIKSDHKNPISLFLDMIDILSDSIIQEPNHSFEELERISFKLSFARDFIDEVVAANS